LRGASGEGEPNRSTVKPEEGLTAKAALPELILPVGERDHRIGPLGARYSLVEYGDYECPHCAHVHPIVREILRELGDELSYVFRNFPQPHIHPHSARASEAAEAADMQGKFWLMHDRLFQHQDELSDRMIRRLAEELPVDLREFERDLSSGAPARRVAEDLESGQRAGVGDTPTFFVNGRLHVGSHEFLPLLKALK
jgi:formate-nitrite transporter family protein